ncbi:MAG: heparinase II/III family protein [Kofleriaceae bacterium]
MKSTLSRLIGLIGLIVVTGSSATASADSHPSLLFDDAELATLKTRACGITVPCTPTAAFQAIRTKADQYLAAPFTYEADIPNANGIGSVHWTYTISGTPPGPHPNNPDYPVWTGLAKAIQERIEVLALAYAMTGEGRYLLSYNSAGQRVGAVSMALEVATWGSTWLDRDAAWSDPEYVGHCCCSAVANRPMKSCLDTAHLSQAVAFAYDVGWAGMQPATRDALRTALIDKGISRLVSDQQDINQNPSVLAPNYRALRLSALAIASAAVAPEAGAPALDWMNMAFDAGAAFLAEQAGDGGAYEGQMYGSYAAEHLLAAADVLSRKGVRPGGTLYTPWLTGLTRFALPFYATNFLTIANFGDSFSGSAWADSLFQLAHATPGKPNRDRFAKWLLERMGYALPNTARRFIWFEPTLTAATPVGSGSQSFSLVGHAALRAGFAGAPLIAVKSGPPLVTIRHNHFDANSFVINSDGEWLAADPGYRDYFNATLEAFTTGSIGHNTVLVDGAGQVSLRGGSLEPLFDGVGYASIVSNAHAAYAPGLLTQFRRRFLYAKPDVFVVIDDIAAPQPHVYSTLLHTTAGGTIAAAGNGALTIQRGIARLDVFRDSQSALTTTISESPAPAQYGPYAETRNTSSQSALHAAMALVPGRTSTAPATAVSWDIPGRGLVIAGTFGTEAFGVGTGTLHPAGGSHGGISSAGSDGELFAIGRTPGNALKRAFLVKGTRIDVNGSPYVTAAQQATIDVGLVGASLYLKETQAGGPYRVRIVPAQVFINGVAVPFQQQGGEAVFPIAAARARELEASPGDGCGTGHVAYGWLTCAGFGLLGAGLYRRRPRRGVSA